MLNLNKLRNVHKDVMASGMNPIWVAYLQCLDELKSGFRDVLLWFTVLIMITLLPVFWLAVYGYCYYTSYRRTTKRELKEQYEHGETYSEQQRS